MNFLTTNQILGALITYNRALTGLSIAKLSAELDISCQHLWDLENDHRTVTEPRIEAIIPLLKTTPEIFWQNIPHAISQLKQKNSAKPSSPQNIS